MNSDGKQQTLTVYHTTHHTIGTVFQTNQLIDTDVTNHMSLDIQIEPIESSTKFQKEKETIPSFPDFDEKYANSTLPDIDLFRDMVWTIMNSVGSI